MPRAKPAARVAAANVAASLAALLSPARAEASRQNGARSRGPKTSKGKARSSQNALKHGLRAEEHVVVTGESAQAFATFEAALLDDLAPDGALQVLLARRVARAAWRLERAERIETELFARQMKGPFDDGDLGLALIRDGNGARAFDTLLRYRGAAQAEFTRALRTLKEMQAEAQARTPIEPEARSDPGPTGPGPAADAFAVPDHRGAEAVPTRPEQDPRLAIARAMPPARTAEPSEPEARGNPANIAPVPTVKRLRLDAATVAASEPDPAPRAGPAGDDGGLPLSRMRDRP